jgi:trans-aconitate methyltransferase
MIPNTPTSGSTGRAWSSCSRPSQASATVVGIDNDPGMVQIARQNYPLLQFEVADGADFHFTEPFDAVFSSAVLHWIRQPERVAACIWEALRPGGRFVAEFGGKGNIQHIVTATYHALRAVGIASPEDLNPWYYPSLGEYATLLERQGFRVTFAVHFDRPTPIEGGEAGMRNWLEMFCKDFLAPLTPDQREAAICYAEDELRPKIYHDGTWVADYKRLRIVAVKE